MPTSTVYLVADDFGRHERWIVIERRKSLQAHHQW